MPRPSKRPNLEKSQARKSLASSSTNLELTFCRRIEDSVREDLKLLRQSPWIKDSTQLVGLKYEIESGKLSIVE